MSGPLVVPELAVFGAGFRPDSPDVAWARETHWYAKTPLFHVFGREIDAITVLRYEDVKALMDDARLDQASGFFMASDLVLSGPLARWWQLLVLNRNGAVHARLRRLIRAAISIEAIEALRPAMRGAAEELVDGIAERGSCDFTAAFAHAYPLAVWFEWLDVPYEMRGAFGAAILGIANVFSPDFKKLYRVTEDALRSGYEIADALIAQRRRRPGNDLVSALLSVDLAGDRFSDDELRATIVGLPFADSSRYQLGNAVAEFVDHPDQWQMLRARPALATRAVEEIMRVRPAIPSLLRLAVTRVDHRDLHVGFGTLVILLIASANTDPRVYGNGGFDISVERGAPPLSFGNGFHSCLGNRFAALEMAEALPVLARRLRTLVPAGTPTWLPGLTVAGPVTLPISFDVEPKAS